MRNEETERKLMEAEKLLRKKSRVEKFCSKYAIAPSRGQGQIVEEMKTLASSIKDYSKPTNQDELLLSEVKRRMMGEAAYMEQQLSGKLYDFDTVLTLLALPREDINSLRPWLEANKAYTQDAIERLFHARSIEGYELNLPVDIPSVRRQAEEFAAAHIQRYHKTLGKFLQSLTEVGEFMRDITAQPTEEGRSYYDERTRTLAIGIPAIAYSNEEGILHIRDGELVRLYGHEGMGHALNFTVTRSGSLPFLLTDSSFLTTGTAESVAQFYEARLLEDLKRSPEAQKKLGIEHKFDGIYQEAEDTELLEDYKRRFFQYGICVVADKGLGDPRDSSTVKRKIEILNEVSLDKAWTTHFVESHHPGSFDSEGNFNPSMVLELRYRAKPVERALHEFRKQGIVYDGAARSLIDTTLLRGLWTPVGFVDNARLRAEGYKS